MVPIPECTDPETGDVSSAMSEQQINTALSYGGLSCVAATITELTGMEIPYAAMVDFDGVIDITNAIGGVTVCLAQPIEDDMTGLYLPAGEVTVSGVDALNFVRTRYGVGDGSDVSRISNQQVFMSALMRQMRSAETLSNPMKVYSLAKAGFENLTMSSSMASIEFLQKLAGTAVNIDLNRVNFVQYPSGTHPYSPGRLSPDRYSGDQLIDIVMSGVPFEVAGVGRAAVTADGSVPAEAPVEGEAPAEGAAPVEGTAPAEGTEAPPVTVLPPNVTGQSAATQTCSAGRTMY
jgi:LCP family protein required for cell wall assembly